MVGRCRHVGLELCWVKLGLQVYIIQISLIFFRGTLRENRSLNPKFLEKFMGKSTFYCIFKHKFFSKIAKNVGYIFFHDFGKKGTFSNPPCVCICICMCEFVFVFVYLYLYQCTCICI